MERVNNFARCEFKPKIKPTDMVINEWYRVIGMRKTKTPFGDSIVVELTDSVLFLPKRLTAVMTKSVIDELLSEKGCLVRFIGQRQVGNNATPANQFEFSKGQ